MSLTILDEKIWFPPAENALSDGLLAIGGDLSIERLLAAYHNGIFPWYEGNLPLWWCPDPRFVLYPQNLKVSKSMRTILNNNSFEYRFNTSFATIMRQCKNIQRKDQDGSWINDELIESYTQLFEAGYAFCAEAWQNNILVGGLYGVKIGRLIFGESMFSTVSNASKFAFINYIVNSGKDNIKLIDCQVYTPHLASLGAAMMPRKDFLAIVKEELS